MLYTCLILLVQWKEYFCGNVSLDILWRKRKWWKWSCHYQWIFMEYMQCIKIRCFPFTKIETVQLLLLEKFLRCIRTLCVVLREARNSPVHSNSVINYTVAARLFRTVLRDRLKNLSRYNSKKKALKQLSNDNKWVVSLEHPIRLASKRQTEFKAIKYDNWWNPICCLILDLHRSMNE